MSNIKCIRCGRRKSVQQVDAHRFRCGSCGALFDDNPDEGGDYSNRSPSARLEREERARERRRKGEA